MRRVLQPIALLVGVALVCAGPISAAAPMPPAVAAQGALEAARARALANDTAGAIAELQAYASAHPQDAEAGRMLGDLYFRTPDPARAEATWKRVVALHPSDLETHLRLATFYTAQGRLGDAIVQCEAALPLRAALLALVDLHRRTGDLGSFVQRFAGPANEYPPNPDDLATYASILRATGRPSEALQYDVKAVELWPRCDHLIGRANDYIDLHRTADARADLERCLSLQPDSYEALADLGFVYLAEGTLTSARLMLERALALEPNAAPALVNLGYIEDAYGEGQAAMQHYLAAIVADPMQREAYADLGYDLILARAYPAAESVLSSGLRAVPADGRLHYLLAETYRNEGRPAQARAEYDAALKSSDGEVQQAARKDLQSLK